MSGSASTIPTAFVDNTPGSTSITLAPGTYDIIATGGGGMNQYSSAPGGTGAMVEGTLPFTNSEALSINLNLICP